MSLFTIILCACLFLVFLIKWHYTFWTRKGVTQLSPGLFYGDLRDFLSGKLSLGNAFNQIYFAFKERGLSYGGIYWAYKPAFVPVDVQLIKNILLKDFSYFQGRGSYHHKNDVLTENLFRMDGDPWKQLRVKLTPTFTSNKMRMMFETLLEKNDNLATVIDKCAEEGGRINASDVASRFTTDVIGSCAFGIECDSLKNPDCDFRVYGRKINRPNAVKQWMENTFPRSLLGYTGYKSFPEVEDFFRDVVTKTIEHREKNNIFRKDFLHLLIQLRNKGVLTDDGKLTGDKNESGILTDDEVLGQCFIFFAAGFDTSSATMAFTLYELAKNQSIQDKTREEIQQVLSKYHGKLTYEGAKELVYTEKVILETLRKYPVLPILSRLCNKDYKIPNSNMTIQKGTMVHIPIWGVHMDPEYYPNPEVYDPERFSEEEVAKRPDFTHLPFGDGPRMCIGARFGMLQSKVGLTGLLKSHKYSLPEGAPGKVAFKPSLLLLHPTEEIWLNIEKLM